MPSLDDIVGGTAEDDVEIEVDFSGSTDFEALNGKYRAQIIAAKGDKSKAGNPVIAWEFAVYDNDGNPRTRKRSTPTTGKGSGLTKQTMKAAGFDVDDVKLRFRPSLAVDRWVTVVMGAQKDSDFDEIKKVLPPEEGSKSQLD